MLKTSEQTLEALQFLRPRYLGPGGDAQALRIIDAAIKQIKHLDELYSGHAETLQKMTAILKKINDAGREGVSDI